MADDSLGNVVLSRPFQFVELQRVTSAVFDREIVWMPTIPRTFEPIKTRWIYAFEVGERNIDQKPILAAEYHADEKGTLGFVPGLKRRAVEATDKSAPTPVAVPAAALPLVRQGKRLRHIFVATRGRMGKRAIWEMENGLHPIYERTDLADDYSFKHAADAPHGPFFVLAIDPLTLGENLHLAYEQALNEAINFTVAHEGNPKKAEVEIRSRKYQLAKMIKDTLLAPEGELTDPFDIRGHLSGGGQPLVDFINEHESTVRKLDWSRRNAARELVRFLNSAVWGTTFKWYLATPEAAKWVGHLWLDASCRCIDRLSETPEGRTLIRELIADRVNGLLSYLYAPEEGSEAEAEERYKERFAIARKAAAAVVIGITETAPALIVYAKTKAANRQIQRTLKALFTEEEVSIVVRAPNGRVARALKISTRSVHVEINYTRAKANLEKWIEEGKPHWPHGTTMAKASDLLARIFMVVELVNLYNEVTELKKENSEPVKVIGAVLDLVVAAEDPIRALATRLRPGRGAGEMGAEAARVEVSASMRGAVTAAEEKEAAGLLGKLVKPAAFKFLGAISAAIDAYFNFVESVEARHRGEVGLAFGKKIVAVGSALLFVGSCVNGIGYLLESAALIGPSAIVVAIGLAIVAVGFYLVAHFSTSSWQRFASRCSFGTDPAKAGHAAWSGGNFSAWQQTPVGIDRQLEVLTTMLCAFSVAGVGFDAQTITVTFGAIPPRAHLELEFSITYDNGQTLNPVYEIDLETDHIACRGDVTPVAQFSPYRLDGRIHSILFTADRRASLQRARVQKSSCLVAIRYGHGSPESTASGTIPIAGPFDYKIFDGSGMGRFDQMSSLDSGAE